MQQTLKLAHVQGSRCTQRIENCSRLRLLGQQLTSAVGSQAYQCKCTSTIELCGERQAQPHPATQPCRPHTMQAKPPVKQGQGKRPCPTPCRSRIRISSQRPCPRCFPGLCRPHSAPCWPQTAPRPHAAGARHVRHEPPKLPAGQADNTGTTSSVKTYLERCT